jgi:membrane protease YdiL (CAAX protease family)
MIDKWLSRIGNIPFIFILFAIALYFWINGPAHFPEWDTTYGSIMIYYIGMFVVFYIFANRATERMIDSPLNIGALQFLSGFIISFVFMTILVSIEVIRPGTIPYTLIWPTIIVQFCVVAPAEELMFRGVLQSYVGILFQAIAFALWHSYAYGIVWYSLGIAAGLYALLFAFIFGLILGYLSKLDMFQLPGVIAMHAVYNCVLIGALSVL